MIFTPLIKLVEDVSSWADLESLIIALPSEQARGEAFEEFCRLFFILDPVFQFREVYRQQEIPLSVRQRLGYPGIQDIGIDGLCVTSDDKLFAYQAKFRSNRKNTPTLRELSTFFTVSDRADWRITITNADSLPNAINGRTKQSRVLSDRLDQLEPDFFDRLRRYLKDQVAAPQEKKGPHRTQQEAIDAALIYFKEKDRGQLILPCGTGKTLASLWIAERLGASHILIMLPSLFLMSQTLREWAVNSSIRPFRYICLCSDTTVDLGNDSPVEHLYEMDVPVTTDVNAVNEFLLNSKSSTSIVFSTYQSSKVLSEAARLSGHEFDLAIFDEAHRTTGTNVGVWNMALHDRHVPAKKRIFMTATPRIYAPHIVKKAQDDDVLICSMDDETIYGKPFYEMTFGDAIERGHITDYKVIVIFVTDAEVSKLIRSDGRVITGEEHEWDAKAIAKRVALAKGMKSYALKKAFTFHGSVKNAKAFTEPDTPYGLSAIFKILEKSSGQHNKIEFFHVNGAMPSGTRKGIMKEFKDAEIGIMSNARCLTEGVDVPTVDTVAFMEPKRSLIDIVQATGRAMRRDAWKKKGYIFIPVILEENDNAENALESSDFDTVWKVLQSMLNQDQRLESIVSAMRVMQGKGEQGTRAWKDATSALADKVEYFNLPRRIDASRFIKAVNTKTLEVLGQSWDFWFGLTLQYKKEHGNPNAPDGYKTPEGFNLGSWQGRQRRNYKSHKLSSDSIKRLVDIGFEWNPFEESFEEGFAETLQYKEKHGTPNAPQKHRTSNGYNLGMWQSHQRRNYKSHKLSLDSIKRLEAIGFIWDKLDEAFEEGVKETYKYKEKFGTPNVPSTYNALGGFNLAGWQNFQRIRYKNNKLSPNRVKRLEDIGFIWNQLEDIFEEGFAETLKYKVAHGSPNVPHSYKTPEGFNLARWQGYQREKYKSNKLSRDKVKRLEAIGFIWDKLEDAYEEGFTETLKYKAEHGSPNVPHSYKTPEGFNLGAWQGQQRRRHKANKLSPDRVKRLEDIGFAWNPLEDAFEEGFAETLKYKEEYGNPNVPQRYKSSNGFNLGSWQSNQRSRHQAKKLASDRIKRLKDIGFTWNKFDKAFDIGFNATLAYKEKHGNPNAPDGYETPEGFNLGSWQSNQRSKYKANKLASERIRRLEEVGFTWLITKQG